jgi:hypothetical protein
MKRIVRLTESDLARIVRRVISEGAGEIPIPKQGLYSGLKSVEIQAADGEVFSSGAMTLNTKQGGKIRNLKPGVVEFDAVLTYQKYYGGKYAGKAFPVKGYYGCDTKRFTAGDMSNGGKATVFDITSMGNIQTAYFTDAVDESGLCK